MQYKDLVQNVLKYGALKKNRTGINALTVPTFMLKYDLDNGFPLTTLRRAPYKSMAVELEGFINGVTNKKWYQENGCKFWDHWANPEIVKTVMEKEYSPFGEVPDPNDAEDYEKDVQKHSLDLGPIYGHQWRNFDAAYVNGMPAQRDYFQLLQKAHIKTCDQFQNIIDTLKSNPNDRRMVCSAWNPNQAHMQALPPCHVLFHICHIDGVLHIDWYQRSTDVILGTPSNLASYSLLLMLLCKETNMKPGTVTGFLSDCHIYENHIDGASELVQRDEFDLPTLEILNFTNIYDWTAKDIKLNNYQYHPKIEFSVAV